MQKTHTCGASMLPVIYQGTVCLHFCSAGAVQSTKMTLPQSTLAHIHLKSGYQNEPCVATLAGTNPLEE